MNRRNLLSCCLMAGTGLFAQACGAWPSRSARYSLDLDLAHGLTTTTMRGVIALQWDVSTGAGFDGVPLFRTKVWGEAPYKFIEGVGVVLALLRPPQLLPGFDAVGLTEIMVNRLPPELHTTEAAKNGSMIEAISLMREVRLHGAEMPRLLRFRDPKRFETAELIDGREGAASALIEVARAFIRPTEDKPTRRISAKELPTFDGEELHPRIGDEPILQRSIAGRLYKRNFIFNGESL